VEGYGPSSAWESAEQRVLIDRPHLLARLAAANSHSAQAELRATLAASVVRWWFLHYRAWAHGLLGAVARQHSSSLDPRAVTVLGSFAKETLTGR
jgi:hypothetical protein